MYMYFGVFLLSNDVLKLIIIIPKAYYYKWDRCEYMVLQPKLSDLHEPLSLKRAFESIVKAYAYARKSSDYFQRSL